MKNRMVSGLLAVTLAVSMIFSAGVPAFADDGVITISSENDFLEFAKQCTLDTWSRGKTVELTCDLDFGGAEYSPIATFGGTFRGNGHKISGLRVQKEGSYVGLFRYIQKGGVVQELSVEGIFFPQGSRSTVGGIAGENSGRIESCTFDGLVEGENLVGGIAGANTADGQIISCTAKGTVTGENLNGGITGENSGLILDCENWAQVNTVYEEKETSLSDVDTDTGAILENLKASEEENEEDGLLGHSDTGGIAGYTRGTVQGCTNYADIGYQHIGYNVGGIAGRQSGYLLGCENHGFIQGRKDVGGIVGQAEPYIILETSPSTLENIRAELDELHAMTQSLIDEADALGDDAGDSISILTEQAENAKEQAEKLLDEGTDFVDDNLGVINEQAAILSNAVDDLSPVFKDLERAGDELFDGLSTVAETLDEADLSAPHMKDKAAKIRKAIHDLMAAKKQMEDAVSQARAAADGLKEAIKTMDREAIRTAAENLRGALSEISAASDAEKNGVKALLEVLPGTLGAVGDDLFDLGGELEDAKDGLWEASDILAYAGDDLGLAMGALGDVINSLAGEPTAEFRPLGDDFRETQDSLFDSLVDISGEIGRLNDKLSGRTDQVSGRLKAVSGQFQAVMELFIGEAEELQEGKLGGNDLFVDVSDEDIENTRQGKTASCQNFGTVEADRNTGGIVGAMAIEYSRDPEDDIEKPDTLNFTYRSKAILEACVNHGEVTGKKDCTGGVVGFSELGTVYECENYGDTQSTSGSYVGGIAGKSQSSIRKSYAKSKLSGERYVGGIAGKADSMTACYSVVTVEGEEYDGSICGEAENLENLSQNFFVDHGLGAVDGVSYGGKAEPIDFYELSQLPEIPRKLLSFSVFFYADEELVETEEIPYGMDTAEIAFPEIPEKEGFFGKWPEIEAGTVTEDLELHCEYLPYITVLASDETDEKGVLALALAEGNFTDEARLHAAESEKEPPAEAAGSGKVYELSLSGTKLSADAPVTYRLLWEGKGRASAWQLTDGSWKKLNTERRGKYVVLQASGTECTVCLQDAKSFVFLAGSGVLFLAAAFLGLFIHRKRKKNHPR